MKSWTARISASRRCTEGMVVKFYAEGDELIDGVIVSRQGRNCSVAMKVDGNVRDVDCGTIVVPSP